MFIRTTIALAMTAAVLLTTPGCAVTRGQESVGNYVDDATITTQVKSRFVERARFDPLQIAFELLLYVSRRRSLLTADSFLITEHALVRTARMRYKHRYDCHCPASLH